MCLYKRLLSRDKGYGVDIVCRTYAPETWDCKDCIIHPEIDKGIGPHHWTVGLEQDASQKESYYLDVENMWKKIIDHLKEHVARGHFVHPACFEILYYEVLENSHNCSMAFYRNKIVELEKKLSHQ